MTCSSAKHFRAHRRGPAMDESQASAVAARARFTRRVAGVLISRVVGAVFASRLARSTH